MTDRQMGRHATGEETTVKSLWNRSVRKRIDDDIERARV